MCKWEIRFLELEKKHGELIAKIVYDKLKNGTSNRCDFIDIHLKIRVYTAEQKISNIVDLFAKSLRDHLMKELQLDLF